MRGRRRGLPLVGQVDQCGHRLNVAQQSGLFERLKQRGTVGTDNPSRQLWQVRGPTRAATEGLGTGRHLDHSSRLAGTDQPRIDADPQVRATTGAGCQVQTDGNQGLLQGRPQVVQG